jgi:dienelactone hydrolase
VETVCLSIRISLTFRYHAAWAVYGFVPFYMFNYFSVAMPKVKSFVENVRNNEGAKLPMGAAGFCWGGRHVVNLANGENAANNKPLVDAVFTGHPSELQIPAEIEQVKMPLSIAVGDKDFVVSTAQVEEIKKILKQGKAKSEVKMYPGAGHGFCVRADPLNEHETEQSIEAEEQAIKWFSQSFASVKY